MNKVLQEGNIVEVNGQRYLVSFIEYGYISSLDKPWVKELLLKGVRDE